MPSFDNIGEFGLDQLLTRRLTTPGGAVAPNVAPELFPSLTLENDRPEWGYLKGERLGSQYVSVGAVAGQFSMVQFYLPSDSRQLVVVERITLQNANAIGIARLVGISGGLGGWVAQVNATRDFRWSAGNSVSVETNQNAASPTRFPLLAALTAAGQNYESPLVIGPATSLGIICLTANQALAVNVSWRERGAQPGELI